MHPWKLFSSYINLILQFKYYLLTFIGIFVAINGYAEDSKSWQISSPYILSEEIKAEDITCNNSSLTIQAEVTGQIFSVGCEIIIGENSLLHQGITFSGGHLEIKPNADIFGDIVQLGGTLKIAPGTNLHGIIRRYPQPNPPLMVLNLSQHYLTFPRTVPNNLDHLSRVAQELRLHHITEKERIPLESFKIKNFLEFLFKQKGIRFAQKWTYEKNNYPIELQIMEFASQEKAFQFWKNILTFTNLSLEHSIQNSLGDGGHWFFRFQNNATLIWHRKSWIFSAHVNALTNSNDIVQWEAAEKELDQMIQIFQKALVANTNNLDVGDRFIGSFSINDR